MRRRLVELARDMLAGRVKYLEGAGRLAAMRFDLDGVQDRDPDFDVFVGIASETDHLPLDAQRALWSATALERLDPEIGKTEAWASEYGAVACRNLIARFNDEDRTEATADVELLEGFDAKPSPVGSFGIVVSFGREAFSAAFLPYGSGHLKPGLVDRVALRFLVPAAQAFLVPGTEFSFVEPMRRRGRGVIG